MFAQLLKREPWLLGMLGGIVFADSEPVELSTPTGTLYGTLELPGDNGPFPVALIIAGSGPTDRDGNNPLLPGKNNSLKLLAEGLARNEIASLRFDKRKIGQSQTGQKEQDLIFDDLVNDAAAWIAYLRKDSRFNRVIVIGHSEGSLIGMLAASKAKADALVSIAGAGQPGDQTLTKQLGANPANPANLIAEIKETMAELKAGRAVAKVNPLLNALFRPSVQPYLISWFRYDPAAEIARLSIPVLIVQGTTDIQVSPHDAELLAAANPKAKLVLIESMNHILKTAPADQQGNIATYSNPDLPLAPGLLDAIVSFVR